MFNTTVALPRDTSTQLFQPVLTSMASNAMTLTGFEVVRTRDGERFSVIQEWYCTSAE